MVVLQGERDRDGAMKRQMEPCSSFQDVTLADTPLLTSASTESGDKSFTPRIRGRKGRTVRILRFGFGSSDGQSLFEQYNPLNGVR